MYPGARGWSHRLRSYFDQYPHIGQGRDSFWLTLRERCEAYDRGDDIDLSNYGDFRWVEYGVDDLEETVSVAEVLRGEPSPLLIFLPGLFEFLGFGDVKLFLAEIASSYAHVVALPNPFHEYFMKSRPNFSVANYLETSRILHQLIKQIVENLESRGYLSGKIHLVGKSHGAFLAAIIGKYDIDSYRMISDTTLISPPLNLGYSISVFDHLIESNYAEYSHLVGSRWRRRLKLLELCTSGEEETRGKDARGVMAMMLQSDLLDAAEDYEHFYESVNNFSNNGMYLFRDFFRESAPEVWHLYEGQYYGNLEPWVTYVLDSGGEMRVMLSRDDWINDFESSYHLPYAVSQNIYFFSRGGHMNMFSSSMSLIEGPGIGSYFSFR